jgi:diguanylate cyclase (GGDEF)-like protein/PAS domain S-box-containing protein
MINKNVKNSTKIILNHQIEELSNSYKVTQENFKIISDNTYNTILNTKEVSKLIYQAKHSKDEKKKAGFRKKLYEKIKPHFEHFKKSGVIIILFSFADNKTFLRMHKPNKFDDDLSSVRYSFVQANSKKEIVRGFEQGKTTHAFRNIYPLYHNKEFIGSVDISFSSEIVQDRINILHKTHTHFLVDKNLFKANMWKREKKVKYIQSIEDENFLFTFTKNHPDGVFPDTEINLNNKLKKEISKNIKHNNSFALNYDSAVIAFYPVKNIKQNKTVAYLVSYEDSPYLKNNLQKHKIINIIFFIILLIGSFVLFVNIKQRLSLQKEVNKKTKDLKYLNENLEEEVQKQNKAFETLFEKATDGILIIQNRKFVQCNEAVVKMLRYESKHEFLNKKSSELSPKFQPDGTLSSQKAEKMRKIAEDKGSNNFEWVHVKADGEEFWVDVTLTPISLADRDIIHVVWRDISYQKKIQQELIEQQIVLDHRANHDSLTQLPNRALFNDRLEQSIRTSSRQKKRFAVLFLDLDRFKQINDSLGHAIGDKVLQEIAKRLKSLIRKEDTLARLGGDEFTILIQDLKKESDAAILAKKIIKTIAEPIYIEKHTLYSSASIGISFFPKDSTDIDDLLMYADNAMYKAKDEGRSIFRYYSEEMTALALSKVVLESGMRMALENEELILFYQPQMNATNGKLIGVEALIRWEHPKKGLISPDIFIPIAQETGLIVELDRWVMKTAMKQVSTWHKHGLNPGVVALNLTIKLLQEKKFVEMVNKSMKEFEFKPEWLEFEVSEGQIMINPENAINKLKMINDMNIGISVDDFGTGYSSLSYLKRLPIDKLKIDKSFIKGLPANEEDVSITKAIIALCKSLNLDVIAEGVETVEQKVFLVENGCVNIQGYFYSKPIPAEEMEKFLIEQNNIESV